MARGDGDPALVARAGLVAFASSRSSRALKVSTSFFVATPMDSICFTTFWRTSRTSVLPASCHHSVTAEAAVPSCCVRFSRPGTSREEVWRPWEERASRPARTYFCMASNISARIATDVVGRVGKP